MEIVRQRKKRLLAWILTLILCVGMWQGSVQAEGEDGGDGALTSPEVMSTEVPPAEVPPTEAEPTEGGDESAEPAAASETGNGDVPVADGFILKYSDNISGDNIVREFGNGVAYTEGSLTIPNSVTSFAVSAKTGDYSHTLMEWTISGSGANKDQTNEISPGSGCSWDVCTELQITWGRIAVLKDNDVDNNIIAVCTQDKSSNAESTQVSLPTDLSNSDLSICYGGKFFSNWIGASGCTIAETANACTIKYSELIGSYNELFIMNYAGTKVPGSGTYTLLSSETYTLGASRETWTVGTDGYEYSGGITFVGPGQSYTYTKIN